MIKKLILTTALVLCAPAFALVPQFYVGAGAGSGTLNQKTTQNNQDFTTGNSLRGAIGYHLGVMFTNHFGLEIGQNYIYNDDVAQGSWRFKFKNNRVNYLAAKGAIDLTPLFTLYGKLGAAYVKNDVVTTRGLVFDPTFEEKNGIRPYGAAGLSVSFSPVFSGYIELSGVPKIGYVPGNVTGMIGLETAFPSI